MGSHLSQLDQIISCGACDNCCASSCARGRCSSVCLGSKAQKPVVHTLSAVNDCVLSPKPERYNPPGVGCSAAQTACGEFGSAPEGGGAPLGGRLGSARMDVDQDRVRPLPMRQLSRGADIPNIGERKTMGALEDESRFNAGKLMKIRRLAEDYSHWRPIRGDGNCYYRTVVFGALEVLIKSGDWRRLKEFIGTFQRVHYDVLADQRAHEQLLRHLRSWKSVEQLEHWVAQHASVDQALIRACRRLVRMFLVQHKDLKSPSGLTYGELVLAFDAAYASVEDFCSHVVDPMGRDAETLALDALPKQLGIGIRLWLLDRRDGVDLTSLDTPGPRGDIDVHVLFKPGHYDLLYPRPPEGRRQGAPAEEPAGPAERDKGAPAAGDPEGGADSADSAVRIPGPQAAASPAGQRLLPDGGNQADLGRCLWLHTIMEHCLKQFGCSYMTQMGGALPPYRFVGETSTS